MPRINDGEQFEQYQFGSLLGSSDANPYFSKYPGNLAEQETESAQISEGKISLRYFTLALFYFYNFVSNKCNDNVYTR